MNRDERFILRVLSDILLPFRLSADQFAFRRSVIFAVVYVSLLGAAQS